IATSPTSSKAFEDYRALKLLALWALRLSYPYLLRPYSHAESFLQLLWYLFPEDPDGSLSKLEK
ncbi:MAG: hypothetical protein DRO05_08005, partial [Thermoproteota archaeon]